MTIITEGNHTAGFILSDADKMSYDQITVASGQKLEAGTILGKITASGKYTAYSNAAADGSGLAAGILYAECDATLSDKNAVMLARLAEVAVSRLTGYDSAADADLRIINIIPRI